MAAVAGVESFRRLLATLRWSGPAGVAVLWVGIGSAVARSGFPVGGDQPLSRLVDDGRARAVRGVARAGGRALPAVRVARGPDPPRRQWVHAAPDRRDARPARRWHRADRSCRAEQPGARGRRPRPRWHHPVLSVALRKRPAWAPLASSGDGAVPRAGGGHAGRHRPLPVRRGCAGRDHPCGRLPCVDPRDRRPSITPKRSGRRSAQVHRCCRRSGAWSSGGDARAPPPPTRHFTTMVPFMPASRWPGMSQYIS